MIQISTPLNTKVSTTTKKIFEDRARTNILRSAEQATLTYLCVRMPAFMTPNLLTFIGLMGSVLVGVGFVLGKQNEYFLLLSIFGFIVQWFGDSLDGRIAYYRNQPRKWFGFSLDMSMDWISTIIIGLAFHYFLPDSYKILAFTFVCSYGWLMILALMKYRVTGHYMIDAGLVGPTELRIAICAVFFSEIIFPGCLEAFAIGINIILVIVNLLDFNKLLNLANERDAAERKTTTPIASEDRKVA
ncbi:MAG: CDP-alcohol phosphatidyltransferase family protein [Chitinophagales bacterium]